MASEYKVINGKKFRLCKYNCGKNISWNDEAKSFTEEDATIHTQDRCKKLKEIKQDPAKQKAVDTLKDIANVTNQKQANSNNNHQAITLEMVLKKLASIGIQIDLEELFKEPEYCQ